MGRRGLLSALGIRGGPVCTAPPRAMHTRAVVMLDCLVLLLSPCGKALVRSLGRGQTRGPLTVPVWFAHSPVPAVRRSPEVAARTLAPPNLLICRHAGLRREVQLVPQGEHGEGRRIPRDHRRHGGEKRRWLSAGRARAAWGCLSPWGLGSDLYCQRCLPTPRGTRVGLQPHWLPRATGTGLPSPNALDAIWELDGMEDAHAFGSLATAACGVPFTDGSKIRFESAGG